MSSIPSQINMLPPRIPSHISLSIVELKALLPKFPNLSDKTGASNSQLSSSNFKITNDINYSSTTLSLGSYPVEFTKQQSASLTFVGPMTFCSPSIFPELFFDTSPVSFDPTLIKET
jgi:hypothetical protein